MAAGRKPRQSGQHPTLDCPRCGSGNTKFCYYNNYNTSQPRHYCRDCERYWTHGGTLRNIPAGGGGIKKRGKKAGSQPKNPILFNEAAAIPSSSNHIPNPNPMLLPPPMFYGGGGGGGGVALGGGVGLPPFNPGGFVGGFSAFQSFNPQFPMHGFNMDQQMNAAAAAAAASAFFAAAPMNNTGINGGGNQEGEGDGFWNRLVLGGVGNGGDIPGGNGAAPPLPLPPPPPSPPTPPPPPPPTTTTTSSSFM
ncbi:uncharacterized protein [Typha latifolia]|uniref:uncharacterized protein n=1 Tax=Typha latifolia TaxID=4733 RepID=UPI003C2EDE98